MPLGDFSEERIRGAAGCSPRSLLREDKLSVPEDAPLLGFISYAHFQKETTGLCSGEGGGTEVAAEVRKSREGSSPGFRTIYFTASETDRSSCTGGARSHTQPL